MACFRGGHTSCAGDGEDIDANRSNICRFMHRELHLVSGQQRKHEKEIIKTEKKSSPRLPDGRTYAWSPNVSLCSSVMSKCTQICETHYFAVTNAKYTLYNDWGTAVEGYDSKLSLCYQDTPHVDR
jgi:hypothetical protein